MGHIETKTIELFYTFNKNHEYSLYFSKNLPGEIETNKLIAPPAGRIPAEFEVETVREVLLLREPHTTDNLLGVHQRLHAHIPTRLRCRLVGTKHV